MQILSLKDIKNKLSKISLSNIDKEKEDEKKNKQLILTQRKETIKKLYESQEPFPFLIMKPCKNGFIVKNRKFYAFLPISKMPWHYSSFDMWSAILPYIIKSKRFFGKIIRWQQDPLRVVVDASFLQYKTYEFEKDQVYKGILIDKTKDGILLEMGYHFGWKTGSIVGFVHKDSLWNIDTFENFKRSEIIEVEYWRKNNDGQLIFGQDPVYRIWTTSELQDLIGQQIPIHIHENEDGNKVFLYQNTQEVIFGYKKASRIYGKGTMARAAKALEEGDIIHCELVDVNIKKRLVQVKWNNDPEITEILKRVPLPPEMPQKQDKNPQKETKNKPTQLENRIINADILRLIEDMAKVEIRFEESKDKLLTPSFIVNDKYKGKLLITYPDYIITKKQSDEIIENLQDGQIIYGKVLKIENNNPHIEWKLSDDEFKRLVNSD